MGFFDSLGDLFTGDAAKKAAAENTARLNSLQTTGLGYLDAGKSGALGSLDAAAAAYDPLKALSAKYGAGTDLYLGALGVNGPQGNQAAVDAFRASPGYQFSVDQALEAIKRNAASTGSLAGGNTLAALSDRAGNMADQEYQNYLTRLSGLIAPELSATQGAATGTAGVDTSKAGVYTNDANNRVNLATTTTNGINDQETQAANAEAQAGGNILKAGLGLASLATGGLGGIGGLAGLGGGLAGAGTSLLGGSTGSSYNGGAIGLGNGGKWSFGF